MATSKRAPSTTVRKPRAKKAAAPAATPAPTEVGYPLTTPAGEPVNVVHLAAELAPFARTGGLGEAVANLALYQRRVGMETAVVMPLYRQVTEVVSDFVPATAPYEVVIGPRKEQAQLFESASLRDRVSEGKPRVYFVANGHYFDRDGIYGDKHGDYSDNAQRWAFFAMAALTGVPQVVQAPVLLHAHD